MSTWRIAFSAVALLTLGSVQTIADQASRERFLRFGAEPLPENQRSPEAPHNLHAADVAKWGEVIRAANATLE